LLNSTTSATVEFAFAPEERDVYSYGRTRKDFAPLGAKPGRGNFAEAAKNDCAPNEPRNKEKRTRQAINISPLWGAATNNVLLHFQLEFL